MKNIAKTLMIMMLLTFGFAFAQNNNLMDWIDNLNDDIPFGYAPGQKISVSAIDNQKVTIQSPLIVDDLGGKIRKYTLMYSEYTLDQMLGQTSLLDQAKEKTFDFTGNESIISMDLGLYDSIDPLKAYYVLIMPKDDGGVGGQISNEIRFKLSDQIYGEGVYVAENNPAHAAAGADMSLAGVSHQCVPDCLSQSTDSKKITIKWISVPGSDKVDISLRIDGIDNDFNKLATAYMSDESYQMTTTANGVHVFNIKGNNNGTEVNYTVNIDGIGKSGGGGGTTPGITKVPTTGPAKNIFIILLISIAVYIGYRKLYRK